MTHPRGRYASILVTRLSKTTSTAPTRVGGRRRPRGAAALAALAIVALVASSCSSGPAWIARIDGKAIDSPNFWKGVPLYTSLVNGGQSPVPASNDKGISPTSDAATYAMFLIQLHGLKQLNADKGIEVTDSDLAETRQGLLSSQQATLFKDLPSWFLDQIVVAQANYQALIDHYGKGVDTNAQIQEYYEKNKAQFRQICMDVISGEESDLLAARQRIDEGSDFATVAKAVAASQPADANGQAAKALGDKADGDVGCVPISTVSNLFADPSGVTALTDAAPDALVGPVPVAGGTFMLFRVRSTETQPLSEVRSAIEQAIGQPGQEKAQSALNDYLRTADIELNPRIGSWKKGVGYQPPVGAETPPGQTTVPTGLVGAGG